MKFDFIKLYARYCSNIPLTPSEKLWLLKELEKISPGEWTVELEEAKQEFLVAIISGIGV